MNGLQTAKVVIVDDDFSEVEPLLRGLSTLGIGSLYFSGDENELPVTPLSGIRLVFLDLHLLAGSGTGHGVLAYTLGVLMRIIPEKKGEVGIVCWTKHPEDKDDLEKLLKERVPGLEAAFMLCLKKADFIPAAKDVFAKLIGEVEAIFKNAASNAGSGKEAAGDQKGKDASPEGAVVQAIRKLSDETEEGRPANVNALREAIGKILSDRLGSRLIWEWEQAVHNAASSTTSLLHDIASSRKEGESREDALMNVLCSLVKAAGGDSMTTPAGAAASLFEGVNPIHADFLDQLATKTDGDAPHYKSLLEAVQSDFKLSSLQKAQTNAAILTARVQEDPPRFQPGNLYIADAAAPAGCPHVLCKIEKFELGYGVLIPAKDKDSQELFTRIQTRKKLNLTDQEVAETKAKYEARQDALLRDLLEKCLPCVVEVTPACDFANKRFTPARFVGCLLVPDELASSIYKGDFIRRINPVTLPGKDGVWHLLLNSRFMFGVSNPTKQITTAPMLRIRLPLLIDMQAWLAAQGARPGYIAT